jgi:hypothetical protein
MKDNSRARGVNRNLISDESKKELAGLLEIYNRERAEDRQKEATAKVIPFPVETEEDEPVNDYTGESEFLARLLVNINRFYLYELPKEEIVELKRISLQYALPIAEYFAGKLDPQPVSSYVSKKNYFIMRDESGEGPAISLNTLRLFGGDEQEKGTGDAIHLFEIIAETNFYGAVRALTEWLIRYRAKRERHAEGLIEERTPLDVLKELVWQMFEADGRIAGKKVLFRKGHGKTAQPTSWISPRALWTAVNEVYGQAALGEDYPRGPYFASPHGMRELLDLWVDSRCAGRFRVKRRWSPKFLPYREAKKIEFAFEPTGIPLDLHLG